MMQRTIELKHVGAKSHVQRLLNELIDRLEERLQPFSREAASVHVVFEEHAARHFYRASLTCHVPGHLVAAHEEQRDPGAAIRQAFAEVERQLERQKAVVHHERLLRRVQRLKRAQRKAA